MSEREIDVLSLDSHRDKGNRRGSFSGLHIIVVRNISVFQCTAQCEYEVMRHVGPRRGSTSL